MKICMNAAMALLLLPLIASAQPAADAWEAEVRQFDTRYWNAFNSCDVPTLAQMNTEDLEFYHDVAGVIKGKATFADTFAKNICGRADAGVRREAIAESMKFYPMRDGGKLYGAIVSGEHRFYDVPKGRAEVLTGQARFTHTLLLKDGQWKVSRVLSFDHGPVRQQTLRAEVSVPIASLVQLAGHYVEKNGNYMDIKRDGRRLSLVSGPMVLVLKAAGKDEFFASDRPLTLTFARDRSGIGRSLTVRENGKIVAQAARR